MPFFCSSVAAMQFAFVRSASVPVFAPSSPSLLARSSLKTVAWCALWAVASAGQAHVALDQPTAPAGSSYRAVFKISHGCSGSATRGMAVQIPPGFQDAKPMPKAGWTLKVRREKLAEPYTAHGQKISDDVAEITWSASAPANYLPDSHYDEFLLRGTAPVQVGPLWFKVTQLCENGQKNWAEVPVSGISILGLKAPAVLLLVMPAALPEVTPAAISGAALPAEARAGLPTPIPPIPPASSVHRH